MIAHFKLDHAYTQNKLLSKKREDVLAAAGFPWLSKGPVRGAHNISR